MRLSVIVPTLNEEAHIEAALRRLPETVEKIVADGGSTDGTRDRARGLARVVEAPRGRAWQLNAGAALATGDVFLFLHADTRLPAQGLREIGRAVSGGFAGGAFLGRFDSNHLSFRIGYPIRDFRIRFFLDVYGDQGIFVRRDLFQKLGGFRLIPIMEDYDFVKRLRREGRVRIIPYPVTMSARRYLRYGVVRQHLKNAWIWQRFVWGADPQKLFSQYEPYWAASEAKS